MVTKEHFKFAISILERIIEKNYEIFYLGEKVINIENNNIILEDKTILCHYDFDKTSDILSKFTINIRISNIMELVDLKEISPNLVNVKEEYLYHLLNKYGLKE